MNIKLIYSIGIILLIGASIGVVIADNSSVVHHLHIVYPNSLTPLVTGYIDLMKAYDPTIQIETISANNTAEIINLITKKGIKADVIIVPDYQSLEKQMIPRYLDGYIRFGNCDMVLAYPNSSPYINNITDRNWFRILARDNVTFGLLNPGSPDVRGWRSLISIYLADSYYGQMIFPLLIPPTTGISESTTNDGTVINAVDVKNTVKVKFFNSTEGLISAVKNGSIDFAWNYRGGSYQNGLQFVDLPVEIDLSNARYAYRYENISVQTKSGLKKSPPIVFVVTIPLVAENPDDAASFIRMIISPNGNRVLEKLGQIPIVPPQEVYYSRMAGILPNIEVNQIQT